MIIFRDIKNLWAPHTAVFRGLILAGALATMLIFAASAEETPTAKPAASVQVSAPAGDVSIASSVDLSEVTVGDKITYLITIEHAPGVEVNPPPLGANLGEFEIQDFERSEKKLDNGNLQLVQKAIIAIYQTGDHTIPPTTLTYTGADGSKQTLQTDPIAIKVTSVAEGEEEGLHSSRASHAIEPDYTSLYLMLGGIGGVLVLAIAGWLLYRRYLTRKVEEEAPPPPRPAHEVALEKLRELESQGWIEDGKVRLFYFALSEVFREYLERRYTIPALESTTEELRRLLNGVDLSSDLYRRFLEFFDDADLVKFADYLPEGPLARQHLDEVRSFVQATAARQESSSLQEVFARPDEEPVLVGVGEEEKRS